MVIAITYYICYLYDIGFPRKQLSVLPVLYYMVFNMYE